MKIIQMKDEIYPNKLKNIKYPPKQLYVLGDESILNNRAISIIGSRCCTEKGEKIAKKFSYELASMGVCIVSGMAEGIDTAAHIGALEAGGKTIAVLGSGFKHVFPEKNKRLCKEIIANAGAVITEFEENVEVFSQGFVQRNRIVSGLSEGTLVIEAKWRSGTSLTAKFAKEQGRKVFCIPHGMDEREGVGTNRLIKEGAILVTEIEDIVKALNFSKTNEGKILKKEIIPLDIPEEYMEVYKLITDTPINVDEICKKTKLETSKINYILTMLELKGKIIQLPGRFFRKE